jgi:hypothetical protein
VQRKVLRNGRKAFACAKDAESDYKDGTLPSGKTIDDYHRYIRKRMFVKLRGATGDDAADHEVLSDAETTKEDQQYSEQPDTLDSEKMPEDWSFSEMIAFFLWSYIVDDDKCAVYKSIQFQIGDTANEERGRSSRKQVKEECVRANKETAQRLLLRFPFVG